MKQAAQHNQTVLDFLLHRLGSIESVMEFCFLNDISLTDDMIIGKGYEVDGLVTDAEILNYFTVNGYIPATATTINTDFGIGEMSIGNTFIIR